MLNSTVELIYCIMKKSLLETESSIANWGNFTTSWDRYYKWVSYYKVGSFILLQGGASVITKKGQVL